MDFFRRAAGVPNRLGIFPGTYNPPTIAHLAMARAALGLVDEVVFVLPRVFPHKHYSGASFEDRLGLLLEFAAGGESFSVAASNVGLFVDIADECREAYGAETQLSFLCGRDAAERVVGWDYGGRGAFSGMLRNFDLLVAARGGEYLPPEELAGRVRRLDLPADVEPVSATEIRDRIAAGLPWEHLVPEAVRGRVYRIYSGSGPV